MIALIGSTGYIGQAYQAALARRGQPFACLKREHLTDLPRILKSLKPSFIINAAGYAGRPTVDACERDKVACWAGNVTLPTLIAAACERTSTPWGHVSSGCLYDGTKPDGSGWTEDDPPNFSFTGGQRCSFYSGTKALGERAAMQSHQAYAWRLRIPFDELDGPRNYLSKMLRYPRLLNVTNSLSHLGDFIETTLDIWERRLPFGIYNVVNPGAVATEDVVQMLRTTQTRASGAPVWNRSREPQYFEDEAAFLATVQAPRSSCVLSTSKLFDAGIRLRHVRDALMRSIVDWQPASQQEAA